MKTLTERLNFSDKAENGNAVKIDRRRDVNYYETLCLYCANNDINLDAITDADFDSAGIALENHGKLIRSENGDIFYFWID